MLHSWQAAIHSLQTGVKPAKAPGLTGALTLLIRADR
jgi:hypothetical protein